MFALSPATSRAMDARSSVAVMMFSLSCARAGTARASASATARMEMTFISPLERVRPVRTDGKLELEQEFVGCRSERVVGAPVLPAHLAELARPERQEQRAAGVEQRRVVGVVGAIVAGAGQPPPGELVVAGDVHAGTALESVRLIAAAPDPFGAADKRAIDRALQRTPPHRGVDAIEVGDETAWIAGIELAGGIVAARVREPEVDVRVL